MSTKKKGKELVPVNVRAAKALAMQDREQELTVLAASTVDITAITNLDGYKQVRSARLTLKNLRVEIQNAGKAAREDATAFSKAVIAEEKRLVALIQPEETRLEGMETAEDERLEAERQEEIDREIARQAALQERIAELSGNQLLTPTSGAALIAEHISDLEAIPVDSFEELQEQAEAAKAAGLLRLREIHAVAVAHEAEQKRIADERAELERLRKEAAERAAAQAEEDRKAKVARDAEAARHAEQLRQQAQDAAKEQAARQKIIDDNNARIAAEQTAAQDKIDAEAARQASAQAEIDRQQEALRSTHERALEPFVAEADTAPGGVMAARVTPSDACAGSFPCARVCEKEAEVASLGVTSPVEDVAHAEVPSERIAVIEPAPPSAEELIAVVAGHYLVEPWKAHEWLSNTDWPATLSEAA